MAFFKGRYSFISLNITQFFGALNDNVFKLLVIYLLINVKGIDEAPFILSTAGAIFVLPFLLFSSAFGVLADRISKRNIIIGTKIVELIVVSLAFFAIHYHSEIGLYALFFLLSSQSAAFGPSKYGIVPEIVPPNYISKATGYMSAFTYLAIILGTFLASFLTDITNKNFMIVGLACEVIAILMLLSTFGIKKTAAKGSKKRINPFFLYEIYKTMAIASKKRYLLPCILGSAFFLFIGGYTQLNAIPFAIQSLNLSEVGGGYLFLATAIGIAIGSYFAGRISKDKVEPGLSCLAGIFLSLLLFCLGIFSTSLVAVIIILILLGVFGGMFLVPFDSFIQIASPDQKRGRIIAASNFLSFCGVLAASLFLYIVNGKFGFSAANGFITMGIITLIFSLFLAGRISEMLLSFIARKILSRFYNIQIKNLPLPSSILILKKGKWRHLLFLFGFLPNLKLYTIGKPFKNFPYFNGLFNMLYLSKPRKTALGSLKKLFAKVFKTKRRIHFACILLEKDFNQKVIKNFLSTTDYGKIYPNVFIINAQKKAKNITFNFEQLKN